MEKETNWERGAAKIFCISAALALLWAAVKYAGGFILASAVSVFISYAVNRGAVWLSAHLRLPKKLCAACLLILLLTAAACVGSFGALRLYRELEGAVVWIVDNRGEIILTLAEAVERLENALGLIKIDEALELKNLIPTAVNSILSSALGGAGRVLSGIGRATPRALIGGIVFLTVTVQLSVDGDRVAVGIKKLIPKKYKALCSRIANSLVCGAKQWIKAYMILFLATFFQLLIGLTVLRAPYPFMLSVGIAAVDILPILGAGAILLPWAAVSLILGDFSFGLGLLILYGVTVAVRQIAEPYIIGEKMGIHPVVSLVSMLVGLYLLGAVGALLSPLAVILVKEIYKCVKEQ